MALDNPVLSLVPDGDAALLRVDNRKPAHMLLPGECAGATNLRFDQGKALPRFGVALESWGLASPTIIPPGTKYGDTDELVELHILTPGMTYSYALGQNELATSIMVRNLPPNDALYQHLVGSGTFTAYDDNLILLGGVSKDCDLTLRLWVPVKTLGYGRFNDPNSADCGILITDDWRTGAGEDGGRGRAWRIMPNNAPQEISLNGHDCWDKCWLTQCYNGVVLHRHGYERHYFQAAAFIGRHAAAHANTILLNCAPNWADGDRVQIAPDASAGSSVFVSGRLAVTDTDATSGLVTSVGHMLGAGAAVRVTGLSLKWPNSGGTAVSEATTVYAAPQGDDTVRFYGREAEALADTGAAGTANDLLFPGANDLTGYVYVLDAGSPSMPGYAFVKQESGNYYQLYEDSALTNQFTWAYASGRFFLERQATKAGFFGSGAPGLILEPSALLTAFEQGFKAVDSVVRITATNGTTGEMSAANHRLQPGDEVEIGTITLAPSASTYFAAPINDHAFRLYEDQTAALVDDGTTKICLPTGSTGTMQKAGASGLAMPPLRSSIFFKGRLIGINGRDNIIISDPMDPLHCSVFAGLVPANLGESGQANWLLPLGEDTLLIGKDNAVLILYNLAGEISTWRLDVVTEEYGGVAALAACSVGTDAQFLSRKGWVSVQRTIAGQRLAITQPLSDSIPQDLNQVDWYRCGQACAVLWQNRLLVAVPSKGQDLDVPLNDRVLSHNQLNQGLAVDQAVLAGEVAGRIVETGAERPSWEGTWQGSLLTPVAFQRLNTSGREWLTFALPDGRVAYLDEGWEDQGAVAIATELVSRGYFGGKTMLALSGQAVWETFNPLLTVKVRSPGYGEEETIESGLEYSNEEFLVDGASGNDFTQPHRADYAMNPDTGLYSPGVPFDVHQAITEPLRMRVRDRAPQLVVQNARGSCRICGLSVSGVPVKTTVRTS